MGMPRRKTMAQGANGAIPLSYSPTKDTVPAMLSPGEFVMNNRAMSLPGAQNLMTQLNAAGNGGGYAKGGPVMDMNQLLRLLSVLAQFVDGGDEQQGSGMPMEAGGGESQGTGAMDPAMILQMLQGAGGGHMSPEGGQPQHFAWGGQVQGQQGGFQQPAGVSRMPAQGFQRQPMGRQAHGRPGSQQGPPQGFGSTPTPPPFFQPPGSTTMPVPNNNPWAGNPTNGANPNIGSVADLPAYQQIAELLKQYAAGGAFSPEGSAALMQSVQGNATSNADAMRARQANSLQLGGMDAGQAAAYKQMADLRGQGDVANALNTAHSGQLMAQDAFGKGLIGTMGSAQMQEYLAQLAAYYKQRVG